MDQRDIGLRSQSAHMKVSSTARRIPRTCGSHPSNAASASATLPQA